MPKKTATAAPEPTPPRSREEMEDLVREICALELTADEMKNKMDQMIMNVRERFEDQITACREDIKTKLELAEMWALANPEEFAGKKSIAMVHGTVGYRTGMPRIKTLKGWTWDRVLNVIKVAFPEYVRTKEEVAKDLIIDQRDTVGADRLQRMGVEIVQVESFYVEQKKEEVSA